MIDIPLNKALVAVEGTSYCLGCVFSKGGVFDKECPEWDEQFVDKTYLPCKGSDRKDGKNVIFKLVDLPEEGKEMNGAERIAAERKRQIVEEGWSAEYDDGWGEDELALAAVCYALPERYKYDAIPEVTVTRDLWWHLWPWNAKWRKPTSNRIRELEKAGALIAAEIDRLLRIEEKK